MRIFGEVKNYLREHLFPSHQENEQDEQVREQMDVDEWMRIMLS